MSRLDDRLNREGERFADHPVGFIIKWGALLLAAAFVIGAIYTVGHFALGWWSTAANVAGPENVQKQYHGVIEDWNAMEAAAGNYCQVKNSGQAPDSLVEDPEFAYAAQYRHITVDYNERQNNIFEAGVVGPGGYPKNAPSLEQMTEQVC